MIPSPGSLQFPPFYDDDDDDLSNVSEKLFFPFAASKGLSFFLKRRS